MLYTLDLSYTSSRNVTLHSPGFPIGVVLTEVVSVADAPGRWAKMTSSPELINFHRVLAEPTGQVEIS